MPIRSVEPNPVHAPGGHSANLDPSNRQQMAIVQEALRLRRLAHEERRLHELYDEHSMFNEASNSRRLMLQTLRAASTLWRRALGLSR